ncbi:MAG: 3'-5' exonuclease [Campylobacterota bacterium]|nr:3'-5' exonuclease [Campylobacterota bacterium]
MKSFDLIISKLKKQSLDIDEFYTLLMQVETPFFDSAQLECELLVSNGFPIAINEGKVSLKTVSTLIQDQVFCVVDIETNGGKPNSAQIIELGAVKYQNGQIIDQYESLVYAKEIPLYIQEVTGIIPKMLEDAPPLKTVLEEFKIFLEDDVFVAHDVKFDYKYISHSFEMNDLGKLNNRSLCTIDLAKKVFKSEKYGLSTLKELLEINIDNHHRALSDALSSTEILDKALNKIDKEVIKTTEDLIHFSKHTLKNKAKKKNPKI